MDVDERIEAREPETDLRHRRNSIPGQYAGLPHLPQRLGRCQRKPVALRRLWARAGSKRKPERFLDVRRVDCSYGKTPKTRGRPAYYNRIEAAVLSLG